MTRTLIAALLGAAIFVPAALAGPVTDFETKFRDAYATYRAALFMTNSGKAEETRKAMAGLTAKWAAIGDAYKAAPPPHYADDAQWAQTLDAVSGHIAKANEEVAQGKLAEAHETLEAVRDEIGDMHDRNNVETFSDRMNAYHAEMEHVLDMDLATLDDAGRFRLHEGAAVLAYLAADVLRAPPAEGLGNPEYDQLAASFKASVETFLQAARSGDAARIKAAVAGLKAPYSKLFLKFG